MSADPLLDRAVRYTDEQIAARLRRHLGNAVDSMGLGVAAGATDAPKSDLRQAVDGAPGRYVRLDWIVPLLRLASSDDRAAFIADLLGAFDLEAVPRLRRSPERRLLDLEALLVERLGPTGRELVDAERGRP
jgi:hypothetical protein